MDLKRISRKLSKILRHDPTPLTMDKEGWILVDDILNYFDISHDDLVEIVVTNDKQRFRFNDDETKICANQGHSKGIAQDKVLTQVTAVQQDSLLYHGTDADAAEKIKNSHIDTGSRQHVHWTTNLELAKKRAKQKASWNKSTPILVSLPVKRYLNHKGKLYLSDNNVYLTPNVPGHLLNFSEL